MRRHLIALLLALGLTFALALSATSVGATGGPSATKTPTKTRTPTSSPTPVLSHKVDICHATSSGSNPFVAINVDDDAVDGIPWWVWSDHGNHDDDIIPPFYDDGRAGYWDSVNWDAEGQVIFYNGCEEPEPTATPVTPTATPVTPTETPITPTETFTPVPTDTPTYTPVPTDTNEPTATLVPTDINTPEPTETLEPTVTATVTDEPTPTASVIPPTPKPPCQFKEEIMYPQEFWTTSTLPLHYWRGPMTQPGCPVITLDGQQANPERIALICSICKEKLPPNGYLFVEPHKIYDDYVIKRTDCDGTVSYWYVGVRWDEFVKSGFLPDGTRTSCRTEGCSGEIHKLYDEYLDRVQNLP